MIDVFDGIMIKNYFSLLEARSRLLAYRSSVKASFYLQTMTTHIEYSEMGMVTRGFRPDREIEKLYSCLELIDRRIERCNFRHHHFQKYLSKLSQEEFQCLESRYIAGKESYVPEQLQEDLLSEISEIETAICYRSNIEPVLEDIGIDLNEDVDENLERLCDFFAL